MKEKVLLVFFALLIPQGIWASLAKVDYEDGDHFTAYVPLNGNDSVEVTFYVISEKEKTVSVGDNQDHGYYYNNPEYDDFFDHFDEYNCAISPFVEGVIVIPSSVNGYKVTSIGHKAFYGCNGLTSIILPNSVTFIGRYAFRDCPKVILPCSTEIIWLDYYFSDGYTYWLGDGTVSVDSFSDDCKICVPVLSLEAYKKNDLWKSLANQIYAIEGNYDYNLIVHAQKQTSGLSSIIGEEHLASVVSMKLTGTINGYDLKVIREKMPFLHYLDLSDVDIVANNYTYYTDEKGNNYHSENDVLGDFCFANMTDLHDIQLPKNIKNINKYAFSGCKTLSSIKLPKGITSIDDHAFEGCNLKTVTVNGSEPALLSSTTFPNPNNLTLLIQDGTKEAYISAYIWKDFKEIIDTTDYIHFADNKVERLCLSIWETGWETESGNKWDTNGDGVLSKEEAANVESLADFANKGAVLAYDSRFLKTDITSFDELQYFTGLTRIEGWTFYDCKNLSSIVIPENVVEIGGGYSYFGPSYAYQEASTVTWEGRDELGAFNGCSSLTSINIPESVKNIDKFAFLGCNGLQEVHIKNMQSWLDIDFGDTNGYSLYGNPLNWSANPLSYAHHLFLDNKEVTSINFPDGVDKVKQYVFSGCQGLVSVNLPNTIKSIGDGAFRGCTNLPSISFPENLTSIGNFTFQDCSSLSKVNLPKGLTELLVGVFAGCTQLKSIDIPSSVKEIGGYYDYWDDLRYGQFFLLKEGTFEGCSSLVSVNISEGPSSIGPNTFKGCTNLSFVDIPESVTLIQEGAFEGCQSLKSINLPNTFETNFNVDKRSGYSNKRFGIGNRLFYNCSNLTSITLPECVDTIGENAFYGCDNLNFVKVKRQEPFSIDENTFPTRANIPLYVPMGSGNLYKAADYWKDFKEIVEVENIDDYVQGEIFTFPVDLDTGKKVLMTFKVTDAMKKTVQVGVGDSAAIVTSTVGGLIIPDKVNDYTVTNIGSYAFYYCSNLTSVSIPNSVKTIGNRAFYVCSGLTSLYIPASVTSIEDRAFAYCSGFETIEVEVGNKYYDSRNSCNALIQTKTNTLLIGCQNSLIPNGVTIIADGAFRGCTELESIEIPEGITKIGTSAFRGCTGLKSVTLPSTITSIGTWAFSAFDKVYNLTEVTVNMINPVTISENVFPNRANSTLYVPKGCKTAYQASAYWKEFKVIKEIGDFDVTDITLLDNAIYMDEKTVVPGNRFMLPIKLKNDQLVSGFQFDVEFPKGISVSLNEKNKFIVAMSDRGSTFSINCVKRSDNTYRFVALSSNDTMTNGDDVTMRISIDVSEDIALGAYCVKFKNGELTGSSGNTLTRILLEEVICSTKVKDMLLGDINSDNAISIVDVVGLVRYILGEQYDNFVVTAADINGDGNITIADVINLINIILNDDSYAKPEIVWDE